MRAPFQVLVVPFRRHREDLEFLIMKRRDAGDWQFVAGGGEDGETPRESAIRELREETGVDTAVCVLSTHGSVPATSICGELYWGSDHLVIPEFAFAADLADAEVALSGEHVESRWVSLDTARAKVKWDSNATAVWETAERLNLGILSFD